MLIREEALISIWIPKGTALIWGNTVIVHLYVNADMNAIQWK